MNLRASELMYSQTKSLERWLKNKMKKTTVLQSIFITDELEWTYGISIVFGLRLFSKWNDNFLVHINNFLKLILPPET